eukprot:scaffold36104_cov72-Isochrysis_galbana.AAC.1
MEHGRAQGARNSRLSARSPSHHPRTLSGAILGIGQRCLSPFGRTTTFPPPTFFFACLPYP